MRILIAEDQPELRRMLVKNLTAAGYTVDGVPDGAEALAYLDAAAYDAAVLDIMMPKVDGLTVLRTLRARGSALPVLLLTARDAVADRVDGLDAGADDYLIKPFAMDELLARLRVLTRKKGSGSTNVYTLADLTVDTPRGRRSGVTGRLSCPPGNMPCWNTLSAARAWCCPGSRSRTACGAWTTPGAPMWWTYTSAICGRSWSCPGSASCCTRCGAWAGC